ncbi:MAG TPA: hypothetical protein VH744_02120 [Terriglobales bacterium]
MPVRTHAASTLPCNQAVQIITIRPIAAETFLVKKALDPAAEAHLVGMILGADRPAHVLVPTTSQNGHGSSRHTRRHEP